MAATRLIAMHKNKGKSIKQCLKDRVDYAENEEKTNGGELVSSYGCDPKLVDEEFNVSKREYYENTGRIQLSDVIAYQIRQSFKPGEITPEEANRIGYETAMRWTKGNHAFIVATHVDRAHIHNHIIYNSTDMTCTRKFRNFWFAAIALQKVSDLVCLENGLSVIKPKKPSERSKYTDYPKRKSFRQILQEDIDACMTKIPKSMDELIRLLMEMSYEAKRGKYVSVRKKGQKRFIRLRSLGEGYREEDLEKVFAGEKEHQAWNGQEAEDRNKGRASEDDQSKNGNSSESKAASEADIRKKTNGHKLDLIIDLQELLTKGKGLGYERWAKVHNVKEMAKTILFLQEHGMNDYDKLSKIASDSSKHFGELSEKLKVLEGRLQEITELKKQIINYVKTKDTYVAYRKSGYNSKFLEEHRDEILIHKAAKEALSKVNGTIPRIKELNEEYQQILQEKRHVYAEYKQAKQVMKDYQTAKSNVDAFLRRDEDEKNQKNRHKTEQCL